MKRTTRAATYHLRISHSPRALSDVRTGRAGFCSGVSRSGLLHGPRVSFLEHDAVDDAYGADEFSGAGEDVHIPDVAASSEVDGCCYGPHGVSLDGAADVVA